MSCCPRGVFMTSSGSERMCEGISLPTKNCATSLLKLLQFHRRRLYVCMVNRGEISARNSCSSSSGMCVSPIGMTCMGLPKCVPPG